MKMKYLWVSGGEWRFLCVQVALVSLLPVCLGSGADIALDAKATLLHRIDSLNLLIYTCLLTLTVLTTWVFKHRRVSWLHETGLAVIYGLIVGAIIRYAGTTSKVSHIIVTPESHTRYNLTLPPDTLWLKFPGNLQSSIPPGSAVPLPNKTYAYAFSGEIVALEDNEIDLKATFDPEIFFNIILPPIIFHAGYCLKRKYFFRNLGAILTYAMIGTTMSSFFIGLLMYGCVQLMPPHLAGGFTFLDTLYFGALLSPTDPLTILAIFSDLHVDVNLYALVFGESVLNDAVALVLSGAIQNYGERYAGSGGFETVAFFRACGDFIGIFTLSLLIGAIMGCLTALLTKFTHVRDFPLLESALFVLMSYSTFLIAEVAELTGVVAVLFCGICQAHYTYNNLSEDSRSRTKQIFELLNFLAENFIFTYIGVSMFTFPKHHFDPWFIMAGFICAALGRAINIYPLSFLLNLGRKPKISWNFQHMLFFAGLRGAMSFALAIRNTVSEVRQAMLTTTSLIVIITVIFQGGATLNVLNWLKIPVGINEETEALPYQGVRSVYNSTENTNAPMDMGLHLHQMDISRRNSDVPFCMSTVGVNWNASTNTIDLPTLTIPELYSDYKTHPEFRDTKIGKKSASYMRGNKEPSSRRTSNGGDKALLARVWGGLDSRYLKPLLTHARPTLLDTLPVCCAPLARLLTTTQQMTQPDTSLKHTDSDSDLCIEDSSSDIRRGPRNQTNDFSGNV